MPTEPDTISTAVYELKTTTPTMVFGQKMHAIQLGAVLAATTVNSERRPSRHFSKPRNRNKTRQKRQRSARRKGRSK